MANEILVRTNGYPRTDDFKETILVNIDTPNSDLVLYTTSGDKGLTLKDFSVVNSSGTGTITLKQGSSNLVPIGVRTASDTGFVGANMYFKANTPISIRSTVAVGDVMLVFTKG